jgi:hypothetical protein
MNWDAIGAVGEAVGAAGVIISLLYLAVQIRGDARAKRVATTHEQAVVRANILLTISGNPDLAELFFRGSQNFAAINGAEVPRFGALLSHAFGIWEDQYFQWCEGHLDPRVWHGIETSLGDFCALPGLQAWWKTRSHWFNEEFQALVRGKIAEGRAPTLYAESPA